MTALPGCAINNLAPGNYATISHDQKDITLKLIDLYDNSYLEDLHKSYHDNGELKQEGNFVNGKREGIWKQYSENGKHIKTEHWNKGNLIVTERF